MVFYTMDSIILASESPRRQDFFRLMGLPFTCMPASIDETPKQGLSPSQIAEDLALRKTMAVAEKLKSLSLNKTTELHGGRRGICKLSPELRVPPWLINKRDSRSEISWIFGADTIVVIGENILGKPADRDAAGKMLRQLAGRRHEVITAMALHNRQTVKTDRRSVSCDVDFAPLTEAEIEWYLDTGEWQGAAGAYRLQELGGCLIKSINGSPSAVAGLPLHEFYVMLRDNGYR